MPTEHTPRGCNCGGGVKEDHLGPVRVPSSKVGREMGEEGGRSDGEAQGALTEPR